MKKLKLFLATILLKLRRLFRKSHYFSLNDAGAIYDLFQHGNFYVTYLNDFQKELVYRYTLIQGGLKKGYTKEICSPKDSVRHELGIINDKNLNYLAKLYVNTMQKAEIVLVNDHPLDKFIVDNYELSRKIYRYDDKEYSRTVAESLRDKRVLVISRAAYLIKAQLAKFENLNPTASSDFKLMALNPFTEIMLTSSGNYFDSLDELKVLLLKLDFDVVLFDDSLYALPLASFVSELGKIGILLGDGLYSMFGIVKKREELEDKDLNWAALENYKDEIDPDFLATGQIPKVK